MAVFVYGHRTNLWYMDMPIPSNPFVRAVGAKQGLIAAGYRKVEVVIGDKGPRLDVWVLPGQTPPPTEMLGFPVFVKTEA